MRDDRAGQLVGASESARVPRRSAMIRSPVGLCPASSPVCVRSPLGLRLCAMVRPGRSRFVPVVRAVSGSVASCLSPCRQCQQGADVCRVSHCGAAVGHSGLWALPNTGPPPPPPPPPLLLLPSVFVQSAGCGQGLPWEGCRCRRRSTVHATQHRSRGWRDQYRRQLVIRQLAKQPAAAASSAHCRRQQTAADGSSRGQHRRCWSVHDESTDIEGNYRLGEGINELVSLWP